MCSVYAWDVRCRLCRRLVRGVVDYRICELVRVPEPAKTDETQQYSSDSASDSSDSDGEESTSGHERAAGGVRSSVLIPNNKALSVVLTNGSKSDAATFVNDNNSDVLASKEAALEDDGLPEWGSCGREPKKYETVTRDGTCVGACDPKMLSGGKTAKAPRPTSNFLSPYDAERTRTGHGNLNVWRPGGMPSSM